MNRFLSAACLGLANFLALSACGAREVISLDKDWRFFQGEAAGAESPGFDSAGWQKVDVPHDWAIAGPFEKSAPANGSGAWLPSGVAWYRKEIAIPAGTEGKQLWVEFDGVMANSEVWINGHALGKRPNGYVSFRYDLTPHLKAGEKNILVVKADTSAQPASRWYAGAGIYRHVRLVAADAVHVAPWGISVTTPEVSASKAAVGVKTRVVNTTKQAQDVTVETAVISPDGKQLAAETAKLHLEAGKEAEVSQDLEIAKPALWNLDSPLLHQLRTTIKGEGISDEQTTPFGIRSAEFKSETGFWLNGRNLKLKGVCLHHEGGAVGAAVPPAVWERRLKALRELGVNAIRTSHNPPAPEFLDLCDRMGLLVMDEFFDCWTKGKNAQDYHLYFKEWSHTDLRDSILRDRNHPSVILYSVGNEIHDTPDPDLAKPILKGLVEVCHEADPSRPVTQALFRPNASGDFTNGLADLLDVIGVNYRDGEMLKAWQDKPGRKIIGTEQGHDRSTWLDCRNNAPHAGQFLWVGIDYLGESRSWPVTTFNGGLLDRAGFVEPRGLERRSWWSEKPMVKMVRRIAATEQTPADPGYEALEWKRRQVLFPDWTPADTGPHEENVEVYSNADEVELFLKGRSLGVKPVRKDCAALNWKVPFEPGEIKAVARSSGKEVASDVLRTAGKAAKLVLKTDRSGLTDSWDDVAHVEVSITDAEGVEVPSASNKISFAVEGPAAIIAVDNGSIVSHESFQAPERSAFQGRALAIVRGRAGQGKVVFKASAEGLQAAQLDLAKQP